MKSVWLDTHDILSSKTKIVHVNESSNSSFFWEAVVAHAGTGGCMHGLQSTEKLHVKIGFLVRSEKTDFW